MFNGQHKFGFVQLNWGNATSYSRVYDPDFRETRISVTDGRHDFSDWNWSWYRSLLEGF